MNAEETAKAARKYALERWRATKHAEAVLEYARAVSEVAEIRARNAERRATREERYG